MAKQLRIIIFYVLIIIQALIAFNCIDAFNVVKNLQQFISSEKIEAEDYSTILGESTLYNDCSDPNVFYMGSLEQDTVIGYQRVNFLDGMNIVILRVANLYSSEALDISLHLGNSSNPPFINFLVQYTGSGRCDFATLSIDLLEPLTGVQDLYFTFPSNIEGQMHLDWFVFNRTKDTFNATEIIQAEDFTSAYSYVVYDDCTDTSINYVGDLFPASLLAYEKVDFGSGVQMVTVRVSSQYPGDPQAILLHVGSYNSPAIVSIPVGQTGSERCDFFTLNAFLDTKPSGVQDLFLSFPSAQGGFLHLDWFVFNQTLTKQ